MKKNCIKKKLTKKEHLSLLVSYLNSMSTMGKSAIRSWKFWYSTTNGWAPCQRCFVHEFLVCHKYLNTND